MFTFASKTEYSLQLRTVKIELVTGSVVGSKDPMAPPPSFQASGAQYPLLLCLKGVFDCNTRDTLVWALDVRLVACLHTRLQIGTTRLHEARVDCNELGGGSRRVALRAGRLRRC